MVKVYFRTVTNNNQTYGKGYFVYGNSQTANDQEIVYHTDLREFFYTDPDTQIDLSKGARGTLHFVIGGNPANAVPARSVFNIEMADPVGNLQTTAKEGSQSCRPGQLGLTNKAGIWLEWPSIGDAAPSWWEEKPGGSSNEGEKPTQPSGGSEEPQPTPPNVDWSSFIQPPQGGCAPTPPGYTKIKFPYDMGKRDFPNSYLPQVDLSKMNLSGIDLSFSYLCAANLGATNLVAANLGYAYLCHAYLGYANLNYAYLGYANLCFADLSYAVLTEADLSFANLCQAKLIGAQLNQASLAYANFCHAYLGYANLSYSYLGYANFCGADLTNADLQGTDMTGANFTNANLTNADLRGANITGANFSNANLTGAKLDDAQKQLLGIA
ncbi:MULTISPECIES: pentapeptide repeat-containing protein [Limnospira]|uniref:pentapeptide repeat-containing protein n=1 Tax=Limnospira TaxID=2596745 RepID=UPI00049F3657|nr:hypothetical protein APPUASWS_012770 [Arthrospira platensis str. Paraca]MDT9309212.1 pentapeptide repeat-containing protein [Limnospira sp. Paracas R14]